MAAVKTSAISSVQQEIADVLGTEMPEGNPNDQKFLKAVLTATLNEELVSEEQWNQLSEEAQQWANDAAEAMKHKKTLPQFPDGQPEINEEDEETEQEEQPVAKKAAKSKKAVEPPEVDEGDKQDEAEQEDEAEVESLQPAQEAGSMEDEDDAEISDGTNEEESEVTKATTRKAKAAKSSTSNGSTEPRKAGRPRKGAAEKPTKAPKVAKAPKESKPKPSKKAKESNGSGSVKGIDAVFKIIARDLKASKETVANKLETQGVEVPKNRLDDLYRKAHKMVDALVGAGKMS